MKKKWTIPLFFAFFLTTLISLTVYFLKQDDRPKVIVVAQRLDLEDWKIYESGAKEAFKDFGIDGKVVAPDSIYPITNQPNLLKKMLKEHPDALIVDSVYPSANNPVLMEYKKKNIPVLFTSTEDEWEYQTAYIGTDNIMLGKTAGKLLGSMLQPGDQVAIIFGRSSNPVMIDRRNGAKEVLEDAGIKVVAVRSGYDRYENSKSVARTILQTYPNLKGIFATTDQLALEALEIIEEKKLKIPVIGTEGVTQMIKAVEAGKINATISENPYDIGYLSVEQAQKVINGENIEKKVDSGIDIITKDNAKDKLNFLKKIVD
ncbi:MAG TPA: sugar ABC transporter substrate-binding protein [Bacillus sp. (in: firmicutes)]|nr:sugar ABC transporter substrate-binding protein [Bacillus sp. (in: firmicutes)]